MVFITENLNKYIKKVFFNKIKDVSFDNLVRYLYKPTDPSSIAVTRMLFGLMMAFDVSEERGGAEIDFRWGNPMGCHFPLIPLQVLPLPYMAIVYGIMWLGAVGIMFGYKFKISTALFCISYWYIFLLEKSFWNNHSYLFGLMGILLLGTQANNYLSIDAYYNKSKSNMNVPYWNYFILKYQIFVLYFIAGLKKFSHEWLSGYAITNQSNHWIFNLFTYFLSVEQTDYFIVHWFAFLFDLTVCFWIIFEHTRPIAMIFCILFHLMNSRLFSIGLFPWVSLSTMPLFCPPDWPKRLLKLFDLKSSKTKHNTNSERTTQKSVYTSNEENLENDVNVSKSENNDDGCVLTANNENNISDENRKISKKQRRVVYLLLTYMSLQAFLPYSHFITKGYNNWTNGLYGYSWDTMMPNRDTILVSVKVVDNESKNEFFVDPKAWVPNDRWTKHGDMMRQYAECLKRNLLSIDGDSRARVIVEPEPRPSRSDYFEEDQFEARDTTLSEDISIYFDVWCSTNGRFQQRMFNPRYDLLKARWSPFGRVEWLMPMLNELADWRETMKEIQKTVRSWNNRSEVLFVADFPGLYLENYTSRDLSNVTLTVLKGHVFYEVRKLTRGRQPNKCRAVHLFEGDSYPVESETFHRIHTVGWEPACYMYTFTNSTKKISDHVKEEFQNSEQPKVAFLEEFLSRINNMITFLQHFIYTMYGVPMVRHIET